MYSLDLPGFAYSERLPGRVTLERLASVLPAFHDSLGVSEAIPVVGNSLGGAVAMQFAAENPDRVSVLVLVDSAGFGLEVTLALRLLTVPLLGEALVRPRPRLRTARAAVRAVFHDPALATETRIARSYRLSQRADHSRTMLEVARDLGSIRGIRSSWRQALLSKIAAHGRPVLLIWGARDRILPASQLAAARAALPQALVTVFADAGHMPQIEKASNFASAVERFLDGAASSLGDEVSDRLGTTA